MEFIEYWLCTIHDWVWGPPLLILLIGTGIFLTFALKGLQFRYISYSLRLVFFSNKKQDNNKAKGDITHFQALMTALAATIGVGTIAGVGTAISIGGLGSIFWMVIVGLVGMATKYSEALLAVTYRKQEKNGTMSGGPMYYIERGLGWKWLGVTFAIFGAITALGTGNMIQAHSVEDALSQFYSFNPWLIGAVLAVCTGAVILGGVRSIGGVASVLVPVMALVYVLSGLYVLSVNIHHLPQALWMIVEAAFKGQAAIGGFLGSTLIIALQQGVSKGIFSNESGLGSAPIAAAAAKTDHPGRQALVAMMGTFFTVLVTFLTGLVIAVSRLIGTNGPTGKTLAGAPLTIEAFAHYLPKGEIILTIGLILFAFSTILGWAYYGERCFCYLFGRKSAKIYRLIFTLMVIPGAVFSLEAVWNLTGIMNALMAVPNLIALIALIKVIRSKTSEFKKIIQNETGKELDLVDETSIEEETQSEVSASY
jgi:AGCS family alanine or glycine:cation symporter